MAQNVHNRNPENYVHHINEEKKKLKENKQVTKDML